jgi:hypothetical protein
MLGAKYRTRPPIPSQLERITNQKRTEEKDSWLPTQCIRRPWTHWRMLPLTFPADEAFALRAKFWSSGYFIRPHVLGRSAVEYLAGKVPEPKYAPIFNSIYDDDNNDNKRLMAKIPLETTRLHQRITTLVQSICPQTGTFTNGL